MATNGWASLGELLSGETGRVSREQGMLQGQQSVQTSAKTQEALAKAKLATLSSDAGARLSSRPADDWTVNPDSLIGDIVAAGYGTDFSGAMQGRNHGQTYDLRATAADPTTDWATMQRSLAAIDGKPVNPITAVGAGGFANIMDERPDVLNTPLGDSLITENTASAAAANALAKLRDEQRQQPERFRSSSAGEPLVQVDTAEGPVYMPRSQAAGQRPSTGRPKVTADNQNAAGFYDRMKHAETLLGDYSPDFKDFASVGSVLGGGAVTSTLANQVMSEKGQSYYQAAADWVRAKLRKESGAAIGKDEMLNEIRTYFPIPGDTPEVIDQKRQAREIAVSSMHRTAGPALDSASSGVRAPSTPASKPATPATNAKGWKLKVDAQGNRAYVSADGKQFEEVQ